MLSVHSKTVIFSACAFLACFLTLPAIYCRAAPLQPGATAPGFTLSALDGRQLGLDDFLARGPVVLSFFRTDCSHCQKELPLLQKLSVEEAYGKLAFVAVNVREKQEVVQPFVDENGITFPVLLDSRMKVTRAYGVPSIPRLFFIDPDGTVRSTIGSADEEVLREHLDALAGGGSASAQKVFVIVPDIALESGSLTVAAVRDAGYEPVVWNMAVQGVVTEEELRRHLANPIIRCIPEDRPEYRISASEENALLGVLSDGGKVFVVGNDMAKSAWKSDLMRYYITIKYTADDAGSFDVSGDGANAEFGSFAFRLREKVPDYGLVRPDVIESGGEDATPVLFYGGREPACAALLVKT